MAKVKSKKATRKPNPKPVKLKMRAKPAPKPAPKRTAAIVKPAVARPAARPAAPSEPRIPSYAELPVRAGAPEGSAWGVFGDRDEVGTINLLTPGRVRAAAGSIKTGKVFALNLPIDIPNPPLFTRQAHRHTVKAFPPPTEFVLDDYLDNFYPQASSQWDALAHVKHPVFGAYNGIPDHEMTGRGGTRLGIDNLARRGIAGRGVLADIGRYYARVGKSIEYTTAQSIPLEDLEATLAAQKSALRAGDILLIRIGWTSFYLGASDAVKEDLARETVVPGIEGSQRVARWIWDHHLAAVASDSPALEALPKSGEQEFMHFHLLAFFGMPIGEMWNLEDLAEDCARDKVYEFFLTSAPLNVPGGIGSPPNALAIK
ncbi:MAG TPA: cyclase family protein [Candidatus Binataceae bacterium]|nr:cyclase family protein [Candidatus Binataceae bacterium]